MEKRTISFMSEKLEKEFVSLKEGKNDKRQLYSFLIRAFSDIEQDLGCSVKISKRLWPKEYRKYELTNLWKYDLPNGWRLIFTLESNEIIVLAIVLEWLSHKDYERRFKY